MIKLDRIRSAEVADLIKAEQQACFRNAFFAAGLIKGSLYVEGFGVIRDIGVPLEHGWIETPEGTVIDPTWYDQKAAIGYFPLKKWTMDEFIDDAIKTKGRLPVAFILNLVTLEAYAQAFEDVAQWLGVSLTEVEDVNADIRDQGEQSGTGSSEAG